MKEHVPTPPRGFRGLEQAIDSLRPKSIDSLYYDPSFITARCAPPPPARHARHVDSPDPSVGTPARLRHRPGDPRAVGGRAAGGSRFAVSRPSAARQEELGDLEMGPDRSEPARQVLSAHPRRQEPAPPRGIAVDGAGERHQPGDASSGGADQGVNVSIRSWWKRRRLDDKDFEEEIRAHLAIAADDKMADGADPRSAQLASRKDFGNVALTIDAPRRVWTPWWLDALHDQVSDVRYAIRSLARNPAFALTVVGVL